jgi:hypothetical protein
MGLLGYGLDRRSFARQAVTQAAAQTGDNSDSAETALLAQVAAYQASTAAITNFQSLIAQGEQASAADRFYSTHPILLSA